MDNTLPMNAETKDKAGVYLTELAGRMLPRFEEENNKKMTTIADPRTKSRGRTDSKTREKYTRNEFEALLEMFLVKRKAPIDEKSEEPKQAKKVSDNADQEKKEEPNPNTDTLIVPRKPIGFGKLRQEETIAQAKKLSESICEKLTTNFWKNSTHLNQHTTTYGIVLVANCEKKEQKRINSVTKQTENIFEAVGKAIKAENFNKGLLTELAKAINSPSYNSRAGKDKA
ncbi:hypothetical protein niasHT_033858 [Heterodera trifolii]|uniref:Uncharacterized protein n=1 Tax=Heterodera trifolii TaxID=157864 RepID=A0ABD2I467_9BILA